jgi:hypothetical protein
VLGSVVLLQTLVRPAGFNIAGWSLASEHLSRLGPRRRHGLGETIEVALRGRFWKLVSIIHKAARAGCDTPRAASCAIGDAVIQRLTASTRFGGHRRRLLEPHEAELRELVAATPDSTLAELQAALERRLGIRAGLSPLHNALRRSGLRLKKSAEGGRAGADRRRRQTPALAGLAALHGPGAVRLPGRDRHRHQPGQALRSQPIRNAFGRGRAARPLAHHDRRRRAAPERHRRAAGPRWTDDRYGVLRLHRTVPGTGARAPDGARPTAPTSSPMPTTSSS